MLCHMCIVASQKEAEEHSQNDVYLERDRSRDDFKSTF